MSELPGRPDLDQLRRQARELLRAAGASEAEALRRIQAVSEKRTLSAAQLAIAREYGFPSWPKLRAEVLRRRASGETSSGASASREVLATDGKPATGTTPKSWREMRDWCARLLHDRTGRDVPAWNELIAAENRANPEIGADEAALRKWLSGQGVTGYAQALLVWETFGYPEFLVADAEDLIDKQYADRPHLRPVFDAVIEILPALDGPVTVQARGTIVSLVSPRRTFAVLKPTTKSRVDLGLRLDSVRQPEGRLQRARDLGQATVRIPLTTPAEVDDEIRDWLKKAYDENTAPPTEPKRAPSKPKPVLGTLHVVIEGTELPGLSCNPEPNGVVHRNIHVAFATSGKGIPEGTRTLAIPGRPGVGAEPFPGDAEATRWETEVTVRGSADDGYDFTGLAVRGDKTDRHLGLVWGDVPGDGTLQLFRGAKLRLVDVPPALITQAMRPGCHLVAHIRLTDGNGNPICARVPSTHLTWSVQPALSRTDLAASPAPPRFLLVLPPRRPRRRMGQSGKPPRIRRKDAACSAASTGSTRRTSGASPGRRNSWTW
ncbi:MAG TPA: DUF5990 family protein [Trebonia sp.]